MPYQQLKQRVLQTFNRHYQPTTNAKNLMQEIGQRLLERLDIMRLRPKVILDLGGGDGAVTQLLAKRYPEAMLIQLDIADQRLCIAKKNTKTQEIFVTADMDALPFSENSVDLIFSNLALHWSFDLAELLKTLRHIIQPKGLLLFTIFGVDTLKELRQSWKQIDDVQHVNTFYDMHDIGDQLLKAGFIDPVMDMEMLTVHYPNVQALLQHIKSCGSCSLYENTKQGLSTKRFIQELQNVYQHTFSNEQNRLAASYEIIYGHALSPEAREGEVRVSVTDIKRRQ